MAIEVGDMVRVHLVERHGDGTFAVDRYETAQVVRVCDRTLTVRYVRRSTKLLVLAFRDHGYTWSKLP
jgi:hypothetical protein